MLRRTVVFGLLALAPSCKAPQEVMVFHASSLSRVFGELKDELGAQSPRLLVRLEPSGSQVAARKVAELGMRADVVAVADASINDRLLVPQHAPWNLVFATNEVVLASREHSRFTQEVTGESWPEVLLRDSVRVGRADEDQAPLGYYTLLSWQLFERARPDERWKGLVERLKGRCEKEHVAPDEAELVALLEAKVIDYAFVFRSTAEDHRLKVTRLPDEASLGDPAQAGTYAAAQVEVRMKLAEGPAVMKGAVVAYGLAVPNTAPHPEAALRFVEALASEKGQRAMVRAGLRPVPLTCSGPCALPERLRPRSPR